MTAPTTPACSTALPNPPPIYDESSIGTLEGLEAVRKRPAMYLGDAAGDRGLHHLVWEVVDNAVDEHLAGACTQIRVTVHADGSVTVEDNGRGIPVGILPEKGVSAAEVVMTVLHSGAKFGNGTYKVSAGLHGVGVSAVNAVSEWLRLEVKRNGRLWLQEYRRGVPRAPIRAIGDAEATGTTVTFKPDPQLFPTTDLNLELIRRRLRELAFLNRGLSIFLTDHRSGGLSETFHYERGIGELVELLNNAKEPVHDEVIAFSAEQDAPTTNGGLPGATSRLSFEVAMQWNASYTETISCYTNNVHNCDGGTHLTGLRAALTKTVNTYGTSAGLFKDLKQGLSGEDVREGLTVVLSLKHPDPAFSSQTKEKLVSDDVKAFVENAVADQLARYFEEHPATATKIIGRAALAAKAREAARKAREVIRKASTDITSLSGKLADCQSKDPERSELYIVEGESAGGSAKQGRDRHFQAILPLKGKILNVERARIDRVLSSAEVGTLIAALGCGVDEAGGFDLAKLRYQKIILMTDADVDGSHIRTLLLTFFYRQMPQVIEKGYLYIAQPPLYRVRKGKRDLYLKDQAALDDFLAQNAVDGLSLSPEAGGGIVRGEPLRRLAHDLRRFRSLVGTLGLRYDSRFVAAAIRATRLDLDDLRDRVRASAATQRLLGYLRDRYPELAPIHAVESWEGDPGVARIEIMPRAGANARPTRIDYHLIHSPDYQEALGIEKTLLEGVGQPPYRAQTGSHTEVLENSEAVVDYLEERGKKGILISRYKGLGEMNASELWETTMNPDARTLLQVRIDDVVKTDELFTILMGDEVEPRRQFIEQNALYAKNLDI